MLGVLCAVVMILTGTLLGGCREIKGTLYDLQEAYDNNYLTSEEIRNIAYYYYKKYDKEDPNGDFTPTPIQESDLKSRVKKAIKQAYLELYKLSDAYTVKDVEITEYYGTYRGNVAVSLRCEGICFDVICDDHNIGGVMFENHWLGDILVFHEKTALA